MFCFICMCRMARHVIFWVFFLVSFLSGVNMFPFAMFRKAMAVVQYLFVVSQNQWLVTDLNVSGFPPDNDIMRSARGRNSHEPLQPAETLENLILLHTGSVCRGTVFQLFLCCLEPFVSRLSLYDYILTADWLCSKRCGCMWMREGREQWPVARVRA